MSAVALVLVFAGVAVIVVSCVGCVCARNALVRLHFLSPVTSAGVPLCGVGIAISDGWSLSTATVLLVVGLMALTGPVVQSATGRLIAEQEGLRTEEGRS
jgi:multicomponent Na+:H+ antiporter subunit G